MTEPDATGPASAAARRQVLRLAGAASVGLAAAVLPGCGTPSRAGAALFSGRNPFALGVASGSPSARSVVLWTRLVTDPLAQTGGADVGPLSIPVQWEVAHDEGFKQLAARGQADAVAPLAHSVHVEVRGLEPSRWYFYRFRVADAVSPVGRTRTAPAPDQQLERVRLVLASCQNWQHGYFHAWRHAAAEQPDLVLFVGDYIYEGGAARGPFGQGPTDLVRAHLGGTAATLAQYRDRYALYKSDPHLQAAHRAAPWLVTWDDHEVANDHAADRGPAGPAGFLARRAAAYQAYWEHMPVPVAMLQAAQLPHMQIYSRHSWGRLAQFHMLDDRQYRDPQACFDPNQGGSAPTVWAHDCPDLNNDKRSLLGHAQEAWLAEGLKRSPSQWNIIGQQTLMAQTNQASAAEAAQGKERYWTDGWNGYRPARERFYRDLKLAQAAGHARDTLVLSGDVHAWYVADLQAESDLKAQGRQAPVLATEFCGTSIASMSWPQARAEQVAALNPQYRYARSDRRGYTLLEVSPRQVQVKFRAVANAKLPDSPIETLAAFEVQRGAPGAQRI